MIFQNFKKIIRDKEFYFHLLIWVFYFLTIHATWTDNWFDRSLRTETVSQFAIITFPLFFYFNAFWLFPKYLKQKKWISYLILVIITTISLECIRILLYLIFNGIEDLFVSAFVNEFNSYDNIIFGRLNPVLISIQFSLIYSFIRDWLRNDSLTDSLKEDYKLTLLFWLFFSPFILFTALFREDYISNVMFIVLGVILITIDVFFITYVLLPKLLFKKHYVFFFISFISIQIVITLIQQSIIGSKGVFGIRGEDFFIQLTIATIDNIKIMAILLGLLLSRKYYSSQNRILKIEKEKNENELKWLKSQVNPHFLFNNLNALDTLIDKNSEQAKAYLYKLSNIYRYLLTTSEKDVVSLQEEWDFIDDYTYLLKERYGNSYLFNKTNKLQNLQDYLIPPATLQNLIENAVKHNHGSIKDPLIIDINIDSKNISVTHQKRLKIDIKTSLGKGLKNLKSRYKLLSNKEINIINSNSFSVVLPQIKNFSTKMSKKIN